jgi:hypothetical protein
MKVKHKIKDLLFPLDFTRNGIAKRDFPMLDLACKDKNFASKLRSKHIILQIRYTYEFRLQYGRSRM